MARCHKLLFRRWPSLSDSEQLSSSEALKLESKGDTMKSSTKDQATGKIREIKGKVKEVAGRATNNPDLEAEGQAEKIVGKVQQKAGQIKKVFGK